MVQKNTSWTKALFVGIWTALNFCRKLFFNVIFIVIIVGIFMVASKEDQTVKVTQNSALVLTLNGSLVIEKTAIDPAEQFFQQAFNEEPEDPEVLIRDVISVLDNAKQDKRITALILDLQGLRRAGLNKLRTVAEAIDDFKTSGKPVYAIADYYTQTQYYLAAHADHVYMNPVGAIMLEGYANYQMYYKRALEKLKITTHIFRVGTYKSAVEPYIREDMSPAAKESNQRWLDAYWEQYKADVASARNMPLSNFDDSLAQLNEKFEQAGGDMATYALQNGWVDALKTREEIRQEMAELVGEADNKAGFKITSFRNYNSVINPSLPMPTPHGDKVGIVVAKGIILDGERNAGTIGGNSTARLLRQARLDNDVKAVVLQVDSPGGSASASEIIRQEVLNLKAAGKPVVVSMDTYAASGGYWISTDADKIFASPSTITGSIGVFGMFMTYENSLDYLGINTDGVATTDMAGLSTARGLSPQYSQFIQRSVESKYSKFLSIVANSRDMTVEDVDKIAQGRVWIGTDALEHGLVDELGDLNAAIDAAAELAELENFKPVYVQRKLSPKEQFWKEFFGQALVYAVKFQFGDSQSPFMGLLKTALNDIDIMASLNDPHGIYTLCMPCNVVEAR